MNNTVDDILNNFKREVDCVYKNERYSVRDNGAILRHPKNANKPRPNDNKWTFGKPGDKGYLYISGVQAHRIVATAFLEVPPQSGMIVDHINTNRQDNRVDNLRWLTKEENLLKNQETLKKVMYLAGVSSIEELRKDNYKALHDLNKQRQNTKWMRPITSEEAEHLEKYQESWDSIQNLRKSKGRMGDWVFNTDPKPTYILSLTPNAGQREWKTPCEFPCCPANIGENPLEDYKNNLKNGKIFSKNRYGEAIVTGVDYAKNKKSLIVKSRSSTGKEIKNFFLAQISFENGLFIHTSLYSYFGDDGQEKAFCRYTGKEWTGGDTFDDFC